MFFFLFLNPYFIFFKKKKRLKELRRFETYIIYDNLFKLRHYLFILLFTFYKNKIFLFHS